MAYLPGKFIATNIRKIQDTVDFMHKNDKQWVILFLDFRKAFDSVLHVFLLVLLSSMGVSPEYVSWVILLYANASSMICQDNWLSKHFFLRHGVRQGCPLSCHLFNLVGQVVVFYLQSQGIFAWWTFQSDPSSLYADDITLILENIDVVPKVIRLIQMYGKFTGLQLNVHKTVGYMPHLMTPRTVAGVKISSDLVKYLGVFIRRDVAEDRNFNSILDKMKNVAKRWRS